MADELLVLGVIHRDPQGADRLVQALDARPWGLISVEVSAFALRWRRGPGRQLLAALEANLPAAAVRAGLSQDQARRHPALAWLRAYLCPPYEWLVAREAAARRGAPCVALDFSLQSRRLLAEAPELVTVANLAQLLTAPAPATAALERRRAADLLSGRGGWPRPPAPEPGREAGLARRLTRLLATARRSGRLPLVHLGGWQHLLAGQNPPGLADRLGLPSQARILA
jgi:hypothetical protein